jgi:hypothetical protein
MIYNFKMKGAEGYHTGSDREQGMQDTDYQPMC